MAESVGDAGGCGAGTSRGGWGALVGPVCCCRRAAGQRNTQGLPLAVPQTEMSERQDAGGEYQPIRSNAPLAEPGISRPVVRHGPAAHLLIPLLIVVLFWVECFLLLFDTSHGCPLSSFLGWTSPASKTRWKDKLPYDEVDDTGFNYYVVGVMEINGTWVFADETSVYRDVKDLPRSCQAILQTDIVNTSTGPPCASWCEDAIGPSARYTLISFLGASRIGVGGSVHVVCSKARTWMIFGHLNAYKYYIMGLYILLGLIRAWFIPPKVDAETKGPSEYTVADDVTSFEPPLCCLHKCLGMAPRSDHSLAKVDFIFKAPLALADNPLEVSCCIVYLSSGQPYYGCGSIYALLLNLKTDPFQAKGLAAFRDSWFRKFNTHEMLEHIEHEGGNESPVGGFVSVLAIVRSGMSMHFSGLCTLIASAASTYMLAIPGSSEANALLRWSMEGMVNIDDFYNVKEKKAELSFGDKNGKAVVLLFIAVFASYGRRVMAVYGVGLTTCCCFLFNALTARFAIGCMLILQAIDFLIIIFNGGESVQSRGLWSVAPVHLPFAVLAIIAVLLLCYTRIGKTIADAKEFRETLAEAHFPMPQNF